MAETKSPKKDGIQMKGKLLKLSVMLEILKDENGQDLIEYALMVAVIAFAATVGMKTLANSMNLAFSHIGTKLTTYIT
jgi:pilus assembly protein Flp/PilA